jgi:hypothetical protein
MLQNKIVMPAKAGIHGTRRPAQMPDAEMGKSFPWMPAFAGMTSFVLCLLTAFCLLVNPAHARFTMDKYHDALKVFTETDARSDLNNINFRMQTDYAPQLLKEYKDALKFRDPKIHPTDAARQSEQRRDAFFEAAKKKLNDAIAPMRERETMFIINSFDDAGLERLRKFFEVYPKMNKALVSYENYMFFTREVHPIFSPDHKKKWEIASDLSVILLKNPPSYMDFSTEEKKTTVYNNLVNYLTNNFKVAQLETMRTFLGGPVGEKLISIAFRIFADRMRVVQEIYADEYPAFATLPQEKNDGSEFH